MRPERILNARSDDLARAEAFVERFPNGPLITGPFEHLPLVIDTNRVLQDIAWLARRRTPSARNSLQELTAAGVVSLYAPEHLIDEVERHIPEIAANVGAEQEQVYDAWRIYGGLIHFIPAAHLDVPAAGTAARDPTDLPFLAAQHAVGAHGIISKDKDLAAMGALVVKHEALRFAVEFARNKSLVVQGNTGIAGFSLAAVGVAYGAYKGTAALARGLRRLPGWLQLLIPLLLASAGAFAIFHKPTREKVREIVHRSQSWFAEHAVPLIDQYFAEMREAEGKANAALTLLRGQVPAPERRPTLKQLAYRVSVASSDPLTLEQVSVAVRRHGYESKSADFHPYLRRVLRNDKRLVEDGDGCWRPSTRPLAPGLQVSAERSLQTSSVAAVET